MKTNISKLINTLIILAALGAGVLYFAQNEKALRPWIPFYNKVNEQSLLALGNLPDGNISAANADNAGNLSGIPSLLFHGIVPDTDPSDNSNTSVKTFETQIKMLKDEGYTSIDTRDFDNFLNGKYDLPEKPVIITFDDGRLDSVVNGDPILIKYGFKAVMFVAVGKQNANDKFFLSWNDVQNMKASGRWDVQVHAGNRYHSSIRIDQNGNTGYFASNKKWLDAEGRLETDAEYGQRLINDINQARKDMEAHLPGIRMVAFAFPYGDYGQDAINIDKDLAIQKNHEAVDNLFPISFGFDGTYGDNFNFFYFKGEDSHLIKRLDIREALTAPMLKHMLDIYVNKKIPYSVDKFDKDAADNILAVWSRAGLNNDGILLKTSENTGGAQANVTGTNYWMNYAFESDITLESGRTAFLTGRFKDIDNYLSCGIDGNEITFRQTVGGSVTLLNTDRVATAAGNNFHIKVEVLKNTASCSVNGISVGRYRIDSALNMGSIGFKTWDPEKGKATITVHNLKTSDSRPLIFGFVSDLPVNNLGALIKEDTQYLDIISPTWYGFNPNGSIVLNEWKMDEIKNNIDASTEIFPSISYVGSGAGNNNQAIIHSMLGNTKAKNYAISSIISLMRERGFTGINLEIENVPANDKDAYANFIKSLGDKMHENNFVLAVSLPPQTGKDDPAWSAGFDYERIGKAADIIVLMAQGKHNLGTAPGAIAPCAWTEEVVRYAVSKIEAGKIILGMPAYGYDWTLGNGKSQGLRSLPVNRSFNTGITIDQKPTQETTDGSEYLYVDPVGNTHSVWLENRQSFACKLGLIDKAKLSGAGLWSIGQEPGYFWQVLQDKKIYR